MTPQEIERVIEEADQTAAMLMQNRSPARQPVRRFVARGRPSRNAVPKIQRRACCAR